MTIRSSAGRAQLSGISPMSAKSLPDLFAIWMRLLAAVPGSVLWLLGTSEEVVQNLRHEAVRISIRLD